MLRKIRTGEWAKDPSQIHINERRQFNGRVEELIRGMHALFYTPNPEELRAFLRDKLGLPYTDTGEGWLVFDVPEADLGCHPSDKVFHSISFYCDHIYETVRDLKSRGVEVASDITDEGWGLLTHFRMPGGVDVELYEPKYKKRSRGGSEKTKRSKTKKTES